MTAASSARTISRRVAVQLENLGDSASIQRARRSSAIGPACIEAASHSPASRAVASPSRPRRARPRPYSFQPSFTAVTSTRGRDGSGRSQPCSPWLSRDASGGRRNALLCVMTSGLPRSGRAIPTNPLPSSSPGHGNADDVSRRESDRRGAAGRCRPPRWRGPATCQRDAACLEHLGGPAGRANDRRAGQPIPRHRVALHPRTEPAGRDGGQLDRSRPEHPHRRRPRPSRAAAGSGWPDQAGVGVQIATRVTPRQADDHPVE